MTGKNCQDDKAEIGIIFVKGHLKLTFSKSYLNDMDTQIGKYLDHLPAYFDDDFVKGEYAFQIMMKQAKKGAIPPANIYQKDNYVEVTMPVPGKEKIDFQLLAQGPHLIVVCESISNSPQEGKPITREYNYDKFSRVFRLPFYVNLEKLTMDYHNGELYIRLEIPEMTV